MIYSYSITLLILCPLIFLATFIDSIAGGGGLISLPAYLFVGLPIHTALGTNKLTASTGLTTAVLNYLRGGFVDFSAAVSGSIFALMGSFIGTWLALSLSPRVLQISLMIILPFVGIFTLVRQGAKTKQGGETSGKAGSGETGPGPLNFRLKIVICSLMGLVFGCYNGFFGPGTGMFMTLILSGLVRLDLVKSAGTTRVINFSSNIASMITWMINGKIFFPVAVPCMICAAAGAFFGSRMAIKGGKRFIRPVLALVAVLLFIKILLDLFNLNP